MAKLNLGFLKRFVRIVPIEETYFIKKEIPNIKLNKEIVKLNYGSLSPFKDGDVIFYKDKYSLYIWFTKNKLDSKKIYIPEGFLLYKEYTQEGDSILIKEIDNNHFGVVVVKNKSVTAQFLKSNIDDGFIEILKKEHSLLNPEIETLGKDTVVNRIDIQDIQKFASSLDINFKSALLTVYEELKIPVIVFLLLLNVFDFFIYKYVSGAVVEKKAELNRIEQSNKAIKDKFVFLEESGKFFKGFVDKELKYPNIYVVLSTITKSVGENGGAILSYRQAYNIVDLRVISNSTSSIVNSLISTGIFDNVQVVNITQSFKDKTKEVGSLELKIKAVKNDR